MTLVEKVRNQIGHQFYKHRDETDTVDSIEAEITRYIDNMSPVELLETISLALEPDA